VKVADQDCARPPAASIARADGKCEHDLHGTRLKGAVSLNRSLDDAKAQDLLTGRSALSEVLSPALRDTEGINSSKQGRAKTGSSVQAKHLRDSQGQ
jgi:hypothetical protein